MSYAKQVRGEKSDRYNIATTRDLTRILTVLSEQRVPRNTTWIVRACCLHSSKAKDALNWLVCNRLVFRQSISGRGWVYSINPAFVEMRGVRG